MSRQIPGNIVSFDIFINGSTIPDKIEIRAINIEQAVNKISSATISVLDGNVAVDNFPVSTSGIFIPGNEIEIKAGYDGQNSTLFKGIIIRQTIRVDDAMTPSLDVECSDKAVKLTVGRKNKIYYDMKDSDVFNQIIGEAGLVSQVETTSFNNDQIVCYYISGWDFLLERAAVNKMVVTALNNKVSVFNPISNSNPVLMLSGGGDIISFNFTLDSVSQFAKVKASAWDSKEKKLNSVAVANNYTSPGDLTCLTLSEVIGLNEYEIQTGAAVSFDELKSWADAQMQKSVLSKITGSLNIQGTSDVVPGNYLSLNGVGTRFKGDHFVSFVKHSIVNGSWKTQIEVGLRFDLGTQNFELEDLAGGLIPGIKGLFIGVVDQIGVDPDGQNRIMVVLPVINESEGIWARLAGNNITNIQPALSLPQKGDEVIVGFLNQDPRYPVILGNLTHPSKRVTRGRKIIRGS